MTLSADTPRELSRGVVSTSVTAVITAPSDRKIRLTAIKVFNTNAITQELEYHTIKDGVTLAMRHAQLLINEGGDWLAEEGEATLEPGSAVALKTTTADAVNYEVKGYELAPVQTTAS